MALACSLAGFSPCEALPNYFTRFWQVGDNGLPENNVTAVVQTRDGYLWLGTRNGLARFDGVRFTVFNSGNTPEIPSSHVACLFEADDGTLWIGHYTGEVTCYKAGKFSCVPIGAAWHSGKIAAICADATGDIWLLNQYCELARVRDGLVIPWPSNRTVHLLALSRNPKGGFWVQRDNDVSFLEDGQLNSLFDEPSNNRYVQGICASRDGGLWVMMDNKIRKWENQEWIANYGPAPWGRSATHKLIETKDGSLAVGTADHGIYLGSPEKGFQPFCRTNGFSSDWVNTLCEDHEGNLWVGTGNGGLAMLRNVNVKTLTPPDQWQGRAVLGIAVGKDGALWAGTEGAGLYCFHDGSWTNYGTMSSLMNYYVWSVAPDVPGGAWAGTWGAGVYALREDRFEHLRGLRNFYVGALHETRDGGMFVGTAEGLLRFDADKLTWLGRRPELVSPDVRTICEGADGTIWFGLYGGGLACLKQGKLRQFRRGDGLSSDCVQCLHLEKDGTLWIGTFGGGLNRLKDGRFVAITKDNGLPSDVICDIQEDGFGFFWMSSDNGLIRVSKAALEKCAGQENNKLSCLSFGLSDGLPSLECSGGFQPAGCKTADGYLWFPTAKGLVGIDPNNIKKNRLPPPVVIEEIRVDGQTVRNGTAATNTLRITPGSHRLEFGYTGLSFVAPERVRFKYRLDGLETEWEEAGTKRFANYSYVPPGHYTFHVTACNNDEVWNESGVELSFTVLPHFWQTLWFRLLAGAMLLIAASGIVWFDTQRRMRRKLDRLERQRAVERERTRIAKDIHDDLGASLTRITMLSLSAREELDNPAQAGTKLDRIYGTARELTLSLAEIVWAVNPKHDTLDSLANYLGKFAQDFLGAADIRCRLQLPMELPCWPLTAEVRHNLFLAFKESLHNVVKHAKATEVQVSLEIERGGFVLSAKDNGCGFLLESPPGLPARDTARVVRGNGLSNIRHRLNEIGGACEIQSAPGAGTKVTFRVPIRHSAG